MVTGGRIVAQIRHAALVGAVLIAAATGSALSAEPAPPAVARPVAAPQRQAVSPKVRAILREVSARRIERSIQKLVSFGTRHTLSSSDDPRRGIGAARDWIYTELQHAAAASPGRMTVVKQSFIPPPEPWDPGAVPVTDLVATLRAMPPVTNLVATLSGAQPASARRVYVISGHYDSRCKDELNVTCDAPGADDDASGVAAVLELARVMAKRTFDATIVFMAVAGEEQALYGSTYFAQQTKQQGVDIEGMFTNDIIGSSTGDRGQRDPFTVRVFSDGVTTSETPWQAAVRQSIGGENDSASRQLARYIKEVGENSTTRMRVWLIWRSDRYLRSGDHIPFLEQGYPAVRFTEPNENFAHQHQDVRVENGMQFGDLPQFVDFSYVARVARVDAAALANLALAPSAPKDARIVTTQPTNDTALTWKPNPEPDLAGYQVVWRASTAPVWTHTIAVGNVTSCTIQGLSKDNVQIGVRAVDRAGYRSPVSFPLPQS